MLRNVIERAFGILKKRFPILVLMTSYPMEIQVMLVKSCFSIHNFIRSNRDYEDEFDIWNVADNNDEDGDDVPYDDDVADMASANLMREDIAQAMWAQYIQHNLDH